MASGLDDETTLRAVRRAAVTGPLGDASLVGTFWIEGRIALDAFPGQWDLDPDDPGRLRYTPPDDHRVTLGDAAVREPVGVTPASSGGPVLRLGASLRATVLRWPGLGLAVRLWDPAGVAAETLDIEWYPSDAAWRIEGGFEARDRTVDYEYRGHGGRLEGRAVVGEVALVIEGRATAMLVTGGPSGLTAVFGDATNGRETYGGGRFVPVVVSAGRAVVDFNRATLPPCAFSPHFDCPLPPPQNVIRSRVPAGEKRIVRREPGRSGAAQR